MSLSQHKSENRKDKKGNQCINKKQLSYIIQLIIYNDIYIYSIII